MRLWKKFGCILLCTAMMALAGACAMPPPAPGGIFYLTSGMTYLRDAATYDSNVVGQLYKNDQVERLDVAMSGWWRVRSGRTGQAGWVPGELFSPNPVPVVYFYATKPVHLRECPKEFCPTLQLLSRGDQVQKVEQNDQGWWRVLVAKSRNLGWLPAKEVAESLEEPQAKAYYYVNVRRLKLSRQPQAEAEVIKLLQFNDQVEKLDQNPAGWFKVRQPASGAVGWVPGRYLETLPGGYPRFEKPRKKKPPAPSSPKPTESEPQIEPEIM